MGRPKEHDDAMRASLLHAAEKLVNDQGVHALSVRAVADEVGTTTRAVYSLFGSKAGLLEALAIRLFELLTDAIAQIELTDDPIFDVVTASVEGFRRVALEHSSLYNLVFLRVVPDLVLGAAFDTVAAQTFGCLESLVSRLPMLGPAPREAARMVHALTEGLVGMELRGALGPAKQAENTWRTAVTTIMHGMTTASVVTIQGSRKSKGSKRT